jgi:hypothetical protein
MNCSRENGPVFFNESDASGKNRQVWISADLCLAEEFVEGRLLVRKQVTPDLNQSVGGYNRRDLPHPPEVVKAAQLRVSC